jgi:hypothetical protein
MYRWGEDDVGSGEEAENVVNKQFQRVHPYQGKFV